jgi:hypothetical protein
MTLQEYLVQLGWKIDEPSMKRFLGVLAHTGAKTAELGATAVETAGAIEAMVTRVARQYESLYYMSQRTSQSVRYIQSTQFAFKQIGLSADEANASIEGIATTLRTQPWLKAIFGGANTPQGVADRLGKSGMPYFLQARFAEMIGMDEKTLFHLQKFGAVERQAQEDFVRRQKAAGIDPEALAGKSVILGRAINSLESVLEIFGERMALDFIDPVTHGVERLTAFIDWLTKADVATNGWISTLGTLAGTVGASAILTKIFGRVLGGGAGTASAAGGIGAGGLAFPLLAAGGAVYGAHAAVGKYGASAIPFLGGTPGKAATDRAKQAADFFEAAGFPRSSAQGIAAGLFSESGLDPNNTNPTSGATGIAQWLTKSRKDAIEKRFGQKIEGSSFEDQLKYVLWELTQGGETEAGKKLYQPGMSNKEAAGTFIHLFERPGAAGEMSDMSRAGPMADTLSNLADKGQKGGDTTHINLNSKTTVNVPPGADVMSTAKAYGDAHNMANENLIRNIQGVVR